MIFFKNNLITFTVLIVAIWVIPVTSDNSAEVQRLCKKILGALNKYEGTVVSIVFNALTCTPNAAADIETFDHFKAFMEPLEETQKDLQTFFIKLKMNITIPEAQYDSVGNFIQPKKINAAKNNSKEKIIELAFKLLDAKRSSGWNVTNYCTYGNLRAVLE